jgi:hypothetical protein
VLPSTWKEFN